MCNAVIASFFLGMTVCGALGYYLGRRRANQAATMVAQQHCHSLLALDTFKIVISRANTRAGHYVRMTTTFQPGSRAQPATPTCCSKPN